jgi:hypothetical protein
MSETQITTAEISRLEHLERVIENGMRSFLEVGSALAEIQQSRLYRAQHLTFESYCQERWEFTASRGRQLIAAVGAIASLPDDLPKPVNAAQAQALAKVAEDERADVWREAIEDAEVDGRTVTAADVEGASRRRASSKSESLGQSNIDAVNPVFDELLATIRKATSLADDLSKSSASAWLLTSGATLLKHLRDAKDHVMAARPAAACPECGGHGCRKCLDTGWVNKARLQTLKK